jgi:hypothetical protein
LEGAVQVKVPGPSKSKYAWELSLFAPPPGAIAPPCDITRPAISTADYYHIDGLYWLRPYDLENNFGVAGQKIAAVVGYRYAWILSPDHADPKFGWGNDAGSIYIGYSNDPAVLPCPSSLQLILPFEVDVPGFGTYAGLQVPWLVYNPDDPKNPFYLYMEGHAPNGTHQPREEELLFVSCDLTNWAVEGVSHAARSQIGLTAYQMVYRLARKEWISFGAADLVNGRLGNLGVWTSSDGRRFSLHHLSIASCQTTGHSQSGRGFPM